MSSQQPGEWEGPLLTVSPPARNSSTVICDRTHESLSDRLMLPRQAWGKTEPGSRQGLQASRRHKTGPGPGRLHRLESGRSPLRHRPCPAQRPRRKGSLLAPGAGRAEAATISSTFFCRVDGPVHSASPMRAKITVSGRWYEFRRLGEKTVSPPTRCLGREAIARRSRRWWIGRISHWA